MTEIPLKIDLFALFIFLGAVQAIFLSYFFLQKHNRKQKANIYLGIFLISAALTSFDTLISYTNFMFRVIYLVDSTEAFNFLFGPCLYLYVRAKLNESTVRKTYFHFFPFFIYLAYSLLFMVQSSAEKYNAYISAYHPQMNYLPVENGFTDPLFIKSFMNELMIISFLTYISLGAFRLITSSQREKKDPNRKNLYRFLWFIMGIICIVVLVVIFSKSYFERDLGDHIGTFAMTVFIYILSFKIIRESPFFSKKQHEPKYSKSSLDESTKLQQLDKIKSFMENEKYYLSSTASLPDLAKKINSSPNHVSQIINEYLHQTFNEMIASYRIKEAIQMLKDPKYESETIEGIAFSVGYNSKSSFNTVFKKLTGSTPSEYKRSFLK